MRTRHLQSAPTRRTCLQLGAATLVGIGAPWLLDPLLAKAASVPPAEVQEHLPNAVLRGSGKLTFAGLRIYDARLWVSAEFSAASYMEHPLALELEYGRKLLGRLISERSIAEIKKLQDIPEAKAQAWLSQLLALFPNVGKGDRITGIQRPGSSSIFFVNGQARGEIQDAELTQAFFSIWFSERTSEPKLRMALLRP